MNARKQIGFFAFLLTLGAVAPAYAKNCLANGICWSREWLDRRNKEIHITLDGGNRIGNYVPKHYNIRVAGGLRQFEKSVSHGFRAFAVTPGTLISVQACRKLTLKSICTEWSEFKPY